MADLEQDTAHKMASKRIVMLIDGGALSWITANAMAAEFGNIDIIVDPGESKKLFYQRRLRMLGPITVAGQIAFSICYKLIARRGSARMAEIVAQNKLQTSPQGDATIHHVASVNTPQCREVLQALDPAVVVVHGTRMIRKKTLAAVAAPFINYHAGLNPAYRGQHGTYWARACGDEEHSGVTLHLVDEGVDTGDVLYQGKVVTAAADSIATYPYLQAVTAIPLMIKATKDALAGSLRPHKVTLPSKQWFHPTIWGYLFTGLTRGVW